MASIIQAYSNNELDVSIRTISCGDETRFVARDVIDYLSLDHTALRKLDDDEKGMDTIPTRGGNQQMSVVTEPGLYKLIMKSRKPEAKAFQRWVTHEVLPSIRKRGGYMVAAADETPEETMARALLIANDALQKKDARIAELEPKAAFADAVASSDGTCLVGELAKMMRQNGTQVGQNRLFQWLREDGYLHKGGRNRNLPTQRSMEMGLFRIKERVVNLPDGCSKTTATPMVTGKGQLYFVRRYCQEG